MTVFCTRINRIRVEPLGSAGGSTIHCVSVAWTYRLYYQYYQTGFTQLLFRRILVPYYLEKNSCCTNVYNSRKLIMFCLKYWTKWILEQWKIYIRSKTGCTYSQQDIICLNILKEQFSGQCWQMDATFVAATHSLGKHNTVEPLIFLRLIL